MFISVIIVTHNSEPYIGKNISSLKDQSLLPDQVIIVDSNSQDPTYLKPYEDFAKILYEKKNIGFSAANNLGFKNLDPRTTHVLFLNPDAHLTYRFIEDALQHMEKHPHCGMLTGPLLGFDFKTETPTGLYDSTGIFTTWWGKWYDRAQGKKFNPHLFQKKEELPAICGALMFCRKHALDTILLRQDEVWDSTFYMYKEDIDLSLRLRKQNWKLLYFPTLYAYHGRGWNCRSLMPKKHRLSSARNEIRINWKTGSPLRLPYSFLKFAAVKLLNI